MTILRLIALLLGLVDNIVSWAKERQLISEGEQNAIADIFKRSAEKFAVAKAAGDAVVVDLRGHSERVRGHDPDERI